MIGGGREESNGLAAVIGDGGCYAAGGELALKDFLIDWKESATWFGVQGIQHTKIVFDDQDTQVGIG